MDKLLMRVLVAVSAPRGRIAVCVEVVCGTVVAGKNVIEPSTGKKFKIVGIDTRVSKQAGTEGILLHPHGESVPLPEGVELVEET